MGEFGKVTKGSVRHINQMRQDAIFADGRTAKVARA
jgi:hypothetical protein